MLKGADCEHHTKDYQQTLKLLPAQRSIYPTFRCFFWFCGLQLCSYQSLISSCKNCLFLKKKKFGLNLTVNVKMQIRNTWKVRNSAVMGHLINGLPRQPIKQLVWYVHFKTSCKKTNKQTKKSGLSLKNVIYSMNVNECLCLLVRFPPPFLRQFQLLILFL